MQKIYLGEKLLNSKKFKRAEKIFLITFFIYFFFCIIRCFANPPKEEVDKFAVAVAEYLAIPVEIIPAMIRVESDYIQNTNSEKGAFGIMQVTKLAFDDYLRFNPNTPYTNFNILKTNWKANIAVGCCYLKQVCYTYGGQNWKGAITSYFWGAWHTNTTETYLKKVKKNVKKYN